MRIFSTTAVALLILAGTATAQQPSQAQKDALRQSCRDDYQSYCSSVPTGGAAALQCLQQHVAQLSQPCQSAVASVSGGGAAHGPAASSPAASNQGQAAAPPASAMSPRQEAVLLRQACGRDFRAYCAGVRPGGGRAVGCLMQNQSRLSRACSGALAEARSR